MFKTIVVATDGTAHGSRVLEVARSMAHNGEHSVVIVHVNQLVGGKGGFAPMAIDEHEVRAALAITVKELEADGISTELLTPTIRLGDPAHEIAEIAEARKADLIVVGRHGHSLLGDVLLGGVPVRLLQLVHCPVLVVPASTADESQAE